MKWDTEELKDLEESIRVLESVIDELASTTGDPKWWAVAPISERETRDQYLYGEAARAHLARSLRDEHYGFYSTATLAEIASATSEDLGFVCKNIDDWFGVYMFIGTTSQQVIKVGISKESRSRVVSSHLRNTRTSPTSNLASYFRREWPQAVANEGMTLLQFPFKTSQAREQRAFEFGLQRLTDPLLT